MTWTQWFIFLLILQIIHGLGTWKLYVKAGRQAWEAFVPVYNAVVLMKIISRPWWWVILMFLPIVNLIMIPAAWVETARAFGKDTKLDALICIVTLGFYLYYLNYMEDVTYIEDRKLKPKTSTGEWITSILFAIVAATIVHTYFFQPFVIPSSSLEKSLLVGDFLIVSKIHYGPRTPMTTVAAPMVHDTIPVLKTKSYLYNDNFEERNSSWKNKLQLPYFRLPGFETVERNDIVVFNQPADTLLNMNDFTPDRNYYKPIDKKTNLVKRCVGLPGDTLELRNGYVFINGKQNKLPPRSHLQFSYRLTLKKPISTQGEERMFYNMLDKADIDDPFQFNSNDGTFYLSAASEEAVNKLKVQPNVASVERIVREKRVTDNIFPQDPNYKWNVDHFGPLWIPKAGATIQLNTENIALYKRAIGEYEGNKVVTRDNQIFINDQPATSYTFKQDYYWMMGDNRHNSIDSRYWGFVPYNHIFGKPVFIWMSIDGINEGIKNWSFRWDRIFTTVEGSGKATSVFVPFIILLILLYFLNKWYKKNKSLKDKALNDTEVYASINDRIKAAIIDSILLILMMYFASELFQQIGGVSDIIKMILFVLIFLLYDPLFTSIYGGTIGHTLSNIGVRKNENIEKNISLPKAIIRFILKAFLGWVSLLTIGKKGKRMAIHDKVVSSVVIKRS